MKWNYLALIMISTFWPGPKARADVWELRKSSTFNLYLYLDNAWRLSYCRTGTIRTLFIPDSVMYCNDKVFASRSTQTRKAGIVEFELGTVCMRADGVGAPRWSPDNMQFYDVGLTKDRPIVWRFEEYENGADEPSKFEVKFQIGSTNAVDDATANALQVDSGNAQSQIFGDNPNVRLAARQAPMMLGD